MDKPVIIIGYSGHGHGAVDILMAAGYTVEAYCDNEEKKENPFNLLFMGSEHDALVREKLKEFNYFIGIGNQNLLRRKVYEKLSPLLGEPVNAIHPSAVISPSVKLSHGHFIAANVSINAFTVLGKTAVCNTGSVIEHGCIVGDFTFIAPGAVLCGDVEIGENSFVGANSVIKQGVKIGKNVIIGAGSVIIENIPDNRKVVGNPAREIK